MLGIAHSSCISNRRRFKASLAALEGEAGGQAKGETSQLQKTIRELTTESKFKDAEIQKLKDVQSPRETANKAACEKTRPEVKREQSETGKGNSPSRS